MVPTLIKWIAIVTGMVAAILWLWSALTPVPKKVIMTWEGDAKEFLWALKKQSRPSAWAASFTAAWWFVRPSLK